MLELNRSNGKIFSHIRKKWLVETPEETVRQKYLLTLVNEYGFKIDQMDEELEVTGRGSGHARADFIIWKSVQDKLDNKSPLIVVECKSDNITISADDYAQGDNYARLTNAQFLVTHNSKETRYWKVLHHKMPKYLQEIENIPDAGATDKEIEELINRLKVFKESEFADLLHKCHNVIRNLEKKDPAEAFDEIAKVLFVKVWVERQFKLRNQKNNIFTKDYLETQVLADNPLQSLFDQTKNHYREAKIFDENEKINLKLETGKQIVELLEVYNLSDTSEDIKGIAFERFLGKTFRGEIGQFFTPRPIVEFMVKFIKPKEDETICDPASGSGGFLIKAFEKVKEDILERLNREYLEYKLEINSDTALTEEEKAELLNKKFTEVQEELNQNVDGSKMWKLSHESIYGCDANERMARTSKMNMIMHGDGHGGVYHNDGFINFGGIFEERFDVILTNPPFGASLDDSQKITKDHIHLDSYQGIEFTRKYGEAYKIGQEKLKSTINKPILSLYDLTNYNEDDEGNKKKKSKKIKTEILFIERCIKLLKPGGRMGIVLPEGIFNNPSTAYIREYCEDRGFIDAIISLPPETFVSSGADVKCSILFFTKYTDKEKLTFDQIKAQSLELAKQEFSSEVQTLVNIINQDRYKQADFLVGKSKPTKEEKSEATLLAKEQNKLLTEMKKKAKSDLTKLDLEIRKKARQILKTKFSYPIFLYDAEKVGITATGDIDKNELYINENQPKDLEITTLELYEQFLRREWVYEKE